MSSLIATNVGIQKEGRWLLRGASLSLESGRVTALVGPNGSGKSTLLRLLCGLWSPTEGRVDLDGKSLAESSPIQIAKRITIVQQSISLRYSFTVREVVEMGRYPHTGRMNAHSDSDQRIVCEAMEKTDIAKLADRHANRLSGGEIQRVLLARCLVTEASTILLDEPTSNLDLEHALDVLHLCRDLSREGKSVVIALHDLSAALRFADEAVVLNEGRLVDVGEASKVLTPNKVQEVFNVQAEKVQSSQGDLGFLFRKQGGDDGIGKTESP